MQKDDVGWPVACVERLGQEGVDLDVAPRLGQRRYRGTSPPFVLTPPVGKHGDLP